MAHDHAHNAPPSDTAMRVKALETLLTEKGLLDPAAIDALVETYETRIGPRNGGRVVARAWTDADYKQRLLEDGTKAIAELGFSGVQGEWSSSRTATRCITWSRARYAPATRGPPLGCRLSGTRARPTGHGRSVIDPRGVLKEFGVELSEDIEVRVWDSNAELRYLVLPQQPAGTEGMSEDELAALVTRDSMIGTAVVEAPTG